MSNPFEVSYEEIERELDTYIDHVFDSLQSELLVFPKGDNFVSYQQFRSAYERVKQTTRGFQEVNEETLLEGLKTDPLGFVVVRSVLGMTAVEWARLTEQEFNIEVPQ